MRDNKAGRFFSGLKGPSAEAFFIESFHERNIVLADILTRYIGVYEKQITIAIIHLSTEKHKELNHWIKSFCQKNDIKIDLLFPSEVKGREYLAGIVIDDIIYPDIDKNNITFVTKDFYKNLSGLYVGISRFRDRVACIYFSQKSPLRKTGPAKHIT